jgi:hypothetical protein
MACSAPTDSQGEASSESTEDELRSMPPEYLPSWLAALKWMDWLKENYPEHYVTSHPDESDSRPWGMGYDPHENPIFAHNAIDIDGVAPRDVLKLLTDGRADTYYPNSGPALDCTTRKPVKLTRGQSYCWVTFGTEQHMKVVEREDNGDETVLAWEGGSIGVTVYHRWIMRRTATGTRVTTEECERGLLPKIGIYERRMNPALRAGHEVWLIGMREKLAR